MVTTFVNNSLLTPLERYHDCPEPGMEIAGYGFMRTRKVTSQMRIADGLARMRGQGVDIRVKDGHVVLTPPYPMGATSDDKRMIDAYWERAFLELLADGQEIEDVFRVMLSNGR